ncbi:MAG: hypothetical protein OJF50_003737 [Nitrospira sp.]|jgi:hypothetical protein|nr:hypothetical protein [Nitrospira sp.]
MGLKGGGPILLARPPHTQGLLKKYITGGARMGKGRVSARPGLGWVRKRAQ